MDKKRNWLNGIIFKNPTAIVVLGIVWFFTAWLLYDLIVTFVVPCGINEVETEVCKKTEIDTETETDTETESDTKTESNTKTENNFVNKINVNVGKIKDFLKPDSESISDVVALFVGIWGFSTIIISWIMGNLETKRYGIRIVDFLFVRIRPGTLRWYAYTVFAQIVLFVIATIKKWGFCTSVCLINLIILLFYILFLLVYLNFKDVKEDLITEDFKKWIKEEKNIEKSFLLNSFIKNVDPADMDQTEIMKKLIGKLLVPSFFVKQDSSDTVYDVCSEVSKSFQQSCEDAFLAAFLEYWIKKIVDDENVTDESENHWIVSEMLRGVITGFIEQLPADRMFLVFSKVYHSLPQSSKYSEAAEYCANWYIVQNCHYGKVMVNMYDNLYFAREFYDHNCMFLDPKGILVLWDCYMQTLENWGYQELLTILHVMG